MSLLMPDLERQLRRAIRSGRVTGGAPSETGPDVPRRRRGSLAAVMIASSAAVALAVAAVILVSARAPVRPAGGSSPRAVSTARATFPAGTWCGEPVPLRDVVGRPRVLARGDRSAWVLARATLKLPHIPRFTGPVLDLGSGQVYLVCGGPPIITALPAQSVLWTLSDDAPAPAGHDHLAIAGVSERSIEHRRVADGTFFVEFLPRSTCADRTITVVLTGVPTGVRATYTVPMPACRPAGTPDSVAVAPPAGLTRNGRRRFAEGAAAVGESGCLACHQIGTQGNHGPGQDLTGIGSRLSVAALDRALTHPRAPMPSFLALARSHPRQFAALVYFLSELAARRR